MKTPISSHEGSPLNRHFNWRFISGSKLAMAGLMLVALFGLFVTWVVLFGEDFIRGKVGEKGSGALGRELVVEGALNIDWHWTTPHVHAEKIRLANIPGRDEPNLIYIESLDFDVKIWKLLFGRVDLPRIELNSPRLVLEKIDQNTNNWTLPVFSKGNVAAETVVPEDRGDFPVIGTLAINNGRFIYNDAVKQLNLDLKLESVSGDGGVTDKNGVFTLAGKGTLQDQPFEIDAKGGSLLMLRDTSKDYPLNLNLTMGGTKISVDGTFNDPVRMTGVNTMLDLQGANLADLFYLTGIPLPPTPPYSLNGKLTKKEDVWSFADFKGRVGDSDLNGNLTYDISGERGVIKADLNSKLLDMDDLAGFIGAAPSTGKGETAATEQKQQAAQQRASSKLLPDVKIDLSRLRAADMNVSLKADRLDAPGLPMQGLNVTFNLNDGILRLDPFQFGMAGGSVGGYLVFDGQNDMPQVESDLTLKRLSLKQFFSDSRFEDFSQGHFGGRILLKGPGRSLAEVAGNSDGRVVIIMGGGQVSRLIIEAAGIDIAEATPLLLGQDDTTAIRCAVGDFTVRNGLLKSNTFVFDTADTNLQGEATINLKNETIAARMEAHPKDPSPLTLRTPVVINGPLKSPRVGVDPAQAAARGGAAVVLGALLTPFASIIPFIETGMGEDSDCKGLMREARGRSQALKGEKAEPAAPQPTP